jgi:phosphoribosylamine--glycine ligase
VRVLLVGGGAREHALAWKLARSPLLDELVAAPGNPGIARLARCVPIAVDRGEDLAALAERERIDFTVIGPEAPLVAGLADLFATRGLLALGPGAAGARIEGSKAFAKDLMARHGIPTARFATFRDAVEARRHCARLGAPLVVKADGLAAGKGALVCRTPEEADAAIRQCLEDRVFGAAGETVVVEEFLQGEEVSVFALVDGARALPLGAAQDHKAVGDGDRGPNTGGMGAYSPVPLLDAGAERAILSSIVTPVVKALAAEGATYRGVLYAGLMMTPGGPRVVEFNCRFGDPECQVLLTRLEDDLLPLLAAAARGHGMPESVRWRPAASVCVNLASEGYPGPYRTGRPIRGLDAIDDPEVHVFHAGTAERDGALVTSGGRVLSVTATGPDLEAAIARAYAAVGRIRFEGMHHRTDIGRRALARTGG